MKWDELLILAKIETVEGQDATPAAANAILAVNVNVSPFEGEEITRNLSRGFMGAQEKIFHNLHGTMSFDVELAGGGAADTPPGFSPLLRGCGMAETITPATSVAYNPISSSEESLSIYFYIGDYLHKFLGGRGTFSLKVNKGLPYLSFNLMGTFVQVANGTPPTADFTAFQDPQEVSDDNTPTVSIHGYAAVVLHSLELALGLEVKHRNIPGHKGTRVTGRNVTGSATIDMPLQATKDFYAVAEARTKDALQLVHGVGVGKVCTVDAPKVQIGKPKPTEVDGDAGLQLPLICLPDTGNDELVLTFT